MNNVLRFEDGHIEYWSAWSFTFGLKIFDCPVKALQYTRETNEHFYGIEFHKELNGASILPSDLAN